MSDSLCIVTTLCAPLATTTAFVNYHLNIGARHLYLYFDDPADEAIEVLQDDPRITCIRCDERHWPGGRAARDKLTLPQRQWFNSKDAWRRAREAGFDWIMHLDSDELVYAHQLLSRVISEVPATVDVLRFRTYEAVPEELQYERPFEEIHYFKRGPCRPTRRCLPGTAWGVTHAVMHNAEYYSKLIVARFMRCQAIRNGYYLRGHIGGKAAVRLRSNIGGMGVHVPTPPMGGRLNSVFVTEGGILHFDACDYAGWCAKWVKRYHEKHVPPSRGRNRAWQLSRFSTAYESGSEESLVELFQQQYYVPISERRFLMRLGLLVEVHPDHRLFQSGPVDSGKAGDSPVSIEQAVTRSTGNC